jgi:hypothetical protein
MNSGEPPTFRHARTGLFTPPGKSRPASSYSLVERVIADAREARRRFG